MQALAKELGVVIVVSLFRTTRSGNLPQHRRHHRCDRTYLGKYRKMHIPDDPLYYEKFTSRRAISDFPPGIQSSPASGLRVLGPMVLKRHGSPRCAARRFFLSHRHRLAPGRKSGYGRRQHLPGRPCSAGMRSPMAAMWSFLTASGTRRPRRPGIEFWGQSFICDPSGEIITKARPTKKT